MQLRHSNIGTTARYIGAGLELRPGMAGVDKVGEGLEIDGVQERKKLKKKLEGAGVKVVGKRGRKEGGKGERVWGLVARRGREDLVEQIRASHRGRRAWVRRRLKQLGYKDEDVG